MATYTALEAVDLLNTSLSDMLDSDESDIEEDPSFPLPISDTESEDEDATNGK